MHDDVNVLFLKGGGSSPNSLWLPQLRVEVGVSDLDTAVRALNSYVGPAAFKNAGNPDDPSFHPLPPPAHVLCPWCRTGHVKMNNKLCRVGGPTRKEESQQAPQRHTHPTPPVPPNALTTAVLTTTSLRCRQHARGPTGNTSYHNLFPKLLTTHSNL